MVRKHHCGIVWLIACCAVARAEDRLVSYRLVDDGIPQFLAAPGDATRGKRIVANADLGNCLICHALPIREAPVFGTVGPDLAGIGARMPEAQLRLRIVNAKALNPATAMPAYYQVDGLQRVAARFAGRPILSAQQVEDVVAYLRTLTDE